MSGNDFADLPFDDGTIFGAKLASEFVPTNEMSCVHQDLREGVRFADIMGEYDINAAPQNVQQVVAVVARYRMRGFRVATGLYETWIATDPTAAPPSGNTLVAISVEARLPTS